ncbi:MAG: S1 RNA-binding domain-containing protein [Candidatus Pacearchaeota archaeon]|jgi:ribosomal protein S1|nr:S1 RNA-binding domain-containing protein [Clostridia bacterium]
MRLTENLSVKKINNDDRIFCQEDYATDLYKLYCCRSESSFIKKDLSAGELVKITGIAGTQKNEIFFEVNNSINIPIDIKKEKRFLELHDCDHKSFMAWITSKEGKQSFIDSKHQILVLQSTPNLRASLLAGYAEKVKDDFREQLKKPTSAFEAKVIGKNQGGFIVDVCGVQAFLPGGLAAANKIVNFDEYIGQNVKVMIEDYLSDINTFIVSHKKYLEHVLPSLLDKHDWTVQHTGIVTGCSKHGVFVEFYGQFTGLLHTSKMTSDVREKFDNRQIKSGSELVTWVREIDKDNRLVLTNFEPGSEEDSIKVDEIHKGKVTGIKDYGVFVRLKSGESGLIGKNNVKRTYEMGEIIVVKITEIKEDKIFFTEETESK